MVRYLTSFARKHGLLRQECVSHCPLVVDGNDLMVSLENRYYDETAGGGIYQNYDGNVATFFCDLQRCGISPVVLLHDELPVRLGISPEDMEFDSDIIQQSYKDHGFLLAENETSQLLRKNIFFQVLRRLEIPHIVCLNDATAEVTALARKLDCPIMGNQNKYLTQNIVAVKVPRKRAVLQLRHPPPGQTGFYMPCEVFHPERFLKKFGITAEMLPLVSTIPGTIPHPPDLFDSFFETLGEQHHSEREQLQRLDLLLPWLSVQESMEAALEEVLCICHISELIKWDIKDQIFRIKSCQKEKRSLEFLRDARTMVLSKGMVMCDIAAPVTPPAPSDPTSATSDDANPSTSGPPIPARKPPLYDPTPPAAKTVPAWVKFPHPPALRQAAASGTVRTSCLRAVYNVPMMLIPRVEDDDLPFSRMAAVPLQARLAALLGTPTQPLLLLGVHRGESHQMLASCTWRAPLLERVLLGGEQSRLRAALSTLQLRPNTLDALPELLRLPAAALVEWRRVTTPRSGRGQVRAVLLTLLAMTPAGTPPSALGLSASAAAEWRARAWPWRVFQPSRGRTDRRAMHAQNELQDVYKTVLSVNEVLDQPLQQLDVVDTIHVPMSMLFGFASSGDAITEPGEEVMSLVDAVADTIEEEVRWWLDSGRQDSGSAGGVSPHWAHLRTKSCHVLRGSRWFIYNSVLGLIALVKSGFIADAHCCKKYGTAV
ncbi:Protein asteroid 1 [Amphibalanus amphitrite]|uniref:Protein asteroid 1 n=1 Tax=Amphibalanus amphitrite TaxID=1232801 RepID=A0A6A4WPR9_AMPAM|nr:Protein asteroid 1 [Amphibalanus amphitrite]